MAAGNLRPAVEQQAHEPLRPRLKAGQIALEGEGRSAPLDGLLNTGVCLQDDLSHPQHRVPEWVLQVRKPLVDLCAGVHSYLRYLA